MHEGTIEVAAAIETLARKLAEAERARAQLEAQVETLKKGERRALDVGEAANLLGVSKITVQRWVSAGKVPFFVLPSGREDADEEKRNYRNVRFWSIDLIEYFGSKRDAAKIAATEGAVQ